MKRALVFASLLFLGWTAVWIVFTYSFSATEQYSSTLFWLTAKILFWVIPTIVLIKKSDTLLLSDLFRLPSNWVKWSWALGTGLLLFALNLYGKDSDLQWQLSFSSLNAVLMTPIVEEMVFRGFIYPNIKNSFSPLWANIFTSFLFALIHCIGWYFQGDLPGQLATLSGGFIWIFFVGLVFGLVAEKSNSVLGSTITHSLNNLGSVLFFKKRAINKPCE